MQTVTVQLTGTSAMLQHRYEMQLDEKTAAKKQKVYDRVEDATKGMYYEKGIGVYVPCDQIEAALRDAAKQFKKGKGTWKDTMRACVFVEPEKIPLGKETYDAIDSRPAVVNRSRIVRHRPLFNPGWSITFTLLYDEEQVPAETLKAILEWAGRFNGIGNYRPKFGRFKVSKFEAKKMAKAA